MTIEDNKQACDTMLNYLKSTENRLRSIYNYGYQEGYKKGLEEATQEIIKKIVGEINDN